MDSDDYDQDEAIRVIEPIRSPSPGTRDAGTNTASHGVNRPVPVPLGNPMDTIPNGSHTFTIEDLDGYSVGRVDATFPNAWRRSTSLDDDESDRSSIGSDFNMYDIPEFTWPLDDVNLFNGLSSIEISTGASVVMEQNLVQSNSQAEPRDTNVQDQVNLVQQLTEEQPQPPPPPPPQPQQQPPQQQVGEKQLVDGGLKRDHPDEDDGDDNWQFSSNKKQKKKKDKKDDDNNDAGPSKI